MNWRMGLTLFLLLAAAASGWSIWTHRSPASAKAATRSDFVLHTFELVSLDAQGKEAFTLRGPRLQRDPGADSMTLDAPAFQVPDHEGGYWNVQAKHGRVPDDGKQLQLHGGVVATSPAQVAPATRIETEALQLFPAQRRASSTAVVTIARAGLTMRGRGLQADFDRQQVSLLSDVHARYVPSTR